MRSTRKRQARLAFSPLPSSSPATKNYNRQIQDRAAAVTLEDSSPAKRRKLRQAGDDSDDEPVRPTQRQTRTRQQRIDFSDARDPSSFDTPVKLSSSSTLPRTSTKAGLFSQRAQTHIESSEDDDSGSSIELQSERSPRNHVGDNNVGQDEDSEEEDMPMSTQQRRQRRAKATSSPVMVESEDEDGMPTTSGTQRRGRKRRTSHSSFIQDSSPQIIPSDSDDVIVVKPNGIKGRGKQRRSSDTESESSSETRRTRISKKRRELSELERQELADDVDDLAPSSGDDKPNGDPRSSQSKQKNARQKALDKLKRIRSSQPTQDDIDEDEEEAEPGEHNEDDSYDEDEDPYRYMNSHHVFKQNAEDADFIEDDDGDSVLGIPSDLPLEYTRYASMKPKELFKYAIEWMVSKTINPAFKSNDSLYQLSFRKLDDEVRGLAGSKFTSSAWTKDFTLALQARPDCHVEELDRKSAEHMFRDKCDACNRSNHPPSWEIQFHDKPYYHATLEEVSHEDEDGHDDDSDEDSSRSTTNKRDLPDWDENGRQIFPESTIFYVGRFCKENAETAHSLHHWRIHLSHAVDLYLSKQGYNRDEEIIRRHKWKNEKQRKYALKIVDRMEEDGEIKRLYHQYRDAASAARSSKQGRYTVDSP